MPSPNPLAIGNVIEMRVAGSIANRPTLLVTRWNMIATPAVTNYIPGMPILASAWLASAIITDYVACLPPNWGLSWVEVQRIAETNTLYPPIRSRAARAYPGAPVVGGWATVSNQPDSAAVIERYSFNSGKTERGEIHVGPLGDSAVALSKITTAMQITLGTLGNDLISTFTFGGTGILEPGAFRRGTKAAPHQPGFSRFYGMQVNGYLSSEVRRRKTSTGLDPRR